MISDLGRKLHLTGADLLLHALTWRPCQAKLARLHLPKVCMIVQSKPLYSSGLQTPALLYSIFMPDPGQSDTFNIFKLLKIKWKWQGCLLDLLKCEQADLSEGNLSQK